MGETTTESSLLAQTRQLLRDTPHTYMQIYDATGLSPNWLSLVATNKIANPSVNSVQKLYEFLTARPLRLPS